jgi:uncharacterized iron-regulated membrane protein
MRTNPILDFPARKILFWIHLAVGCLAAVVILIMSVTGVLLAYKRQITSWSDRAAHRTSPPGSTALPIESMLAPIIGRQHAAPSAITLHADLSAAAEVSFGRDHVFLIDPATGDVLGESSPAWRSFFQKVEDWHRWLGADTEHRSALRAIAGACNFGFLLLAISGPFLWMPRKWSWRSVRSIALFRGGLSGRARDFNWHNTIGIWCAVPIAVITLTGVVMSYPWANDLLYRLTGTVPAPQSGGRGGAEGRGRQDGPGLAGWNALWARAEQQVPGWRSISVRPIGRGPVAFTIDKGDGGRPDLRSQLTLDRRTAAVVRWKPFSSYNSRRQLRSWFRFLHTGEAGGLAGETAASIASTGGAVLVWTGVCLAIRRFFRWSKRKPATPVKVESESAAVINV